MPELITPAVWMIILAALGYALGSVAFGLVIARLFNLGDLRQIGSGNIGATNVLRTGNRLAALLTLLLDAGKAALAVLLARLVAGEDAAVLAGVAAFFGHCYPVWLRFNGGKGVATFFGLLLVLSLPLCLACGAIWLACAALTRFSSLSAILAAGAAPVLATWLAPHLVAPLVVLAALILWTHRMNLRRLLNGTESKIGR